MNTQRPHGSPHPAPRAAWLCLPALLGLAPACFSEVEQLDPSPLGPVAHSAEEAWPEAPQAVPPITHEDIARACVVAGACIPENEGIDHESMLGLIDLCVHDAVFSAERAIPLSGFVQRNERAERFVSCTLTAADCDGVNACATERAIDMYCEEAGCRPSASASYEVSCVGTTAVLAAGATTVERDCALAFAVCDGASPTGCTDRHPSACPEGDDRADRCDGNIRLGCDGSEQVSYRDCTRMGGLCGSLTGGGEGCIYPGPVAAECVGEATLGAECDGTQLRVCVNQRRVTVEAAEICPAG